MSLPWSFRELTGVIEYMMKELRREHSREQKFSQVSFSQTSNLSHKMFFYQNHVHFGQSVSVTDWDFNWKQQIIYHFFKGV